MNARNMSPMAKLVAPRTSHEHAPARVSRLNFDPLDLFAAFGEALAAASPPRHIDLQLTCQ
jgi:hypothetical protein